MNANDICPVCGEGHLTTHLSTGEVEYKKMKGTVPLRYLECDACGSEIASPADLRANKRAMVAFRKKMENLLSGAEVKALRDKYGLTQETAQRIFGGGPVAFSKYENDDVAQSEQMDALLRLALADPQNLLRLAQRKGIGITVPIGIVQAPFNVATSGLVIASPLQQWQPMGSFTAVATVQAREDIPPLALYLSVDNVFEARLQ